MGIEKHMMAVLAEIGAIRIIFLHALSLRLLEEPEPQMALSMMEHNITTTPTRPNDSGVFDPAMSDMLAAMTDEHIRTLLNEVRARLRRPTAQAS